jgi:membrane-associated phospholipid phosphatase
MSEHSLATERSGPPILILGPDCDDVLLAVSPACDDRRVSDDDLDDFDAVDDPDARSIGDRDVTQWSPVGQVAVEAHRHLAQRIGTAPAFVVSVAIGTGLAAAATFFGTRVYDGLAGSSGVASLDKPALRRAIRLRSPATNVAAASIARVFGPVGMPVLVVCTATALSRQRRSRSPAVLMGSAGIGSLLMTLAGKDIVRRHRPPRRKAIPPYETSPSFPSGHTLNATTITGIVAYLLMLRQKGYATQALTATAAVATAGTVGLSRVLLGAHWFSDVVMGWVSGIGWLSLVITSHRLHLTIQRRGTADARSGASNAAR